MSGVISAVFFLFFLFDHIVNEESVSMINQEKIISNKVNHLILLLTLDLHLFFLSKAIDEEEEEDFNKR